MRKSTIILFACTLFVLGVGAHSYFNFDFFYLYIFLLGFLVLLAINWTKKLFRIILFGAVFFILGFWRYELSTIKIDSSRIQFYNNQEAEFIGVVSQEPDIRINNLKLTIKSEQVNLTRQTSQVGGKVLVTTNLYPEYKYGDKLKIICKLLEPEPFEGFDYDRYLARYDIYSLCYYPKIELLNTGQGNYLLTQIYKLKTKAKELINSGLPEPQASLFSAITLGLRRGIPQSLLDKLAIVGIMHLIAISGLHITTIIAVLMAVAPYFYIHRKIAFYLITVLLILYVILIGFPASAVRASIMGFLVLWAMYLGRLNKSLNALVIVAAIMIAINPKILRDDVGFQLSFSAVLGIIYFSPLFEKLFEKIPKKYNLFTAALQMSLSAQIMTMPLIIYHFGRLSLIAIPANLLVVPTLPYFLPLGFFSIGLSFLAQKISWLVFAPVWLALTYIIKLTEFFANLPLAAVEIKSFSAPLVILSYLFIFYLLKRSYKKYKI